MIFVCFIHIRNMKKSSTIRMSMFCPDVPQTPFGMDRNVTKRRAPKTTKKAADSSKLSLRRPERAADPPSDQENAPPPAFPLTPRRQGRRLFSQPEIVEIEPAAELPLLTARPPLRPTAAQRANHQPEKLQLKQPEPCRGAGADDGELETDALLQKMAEMSLAEDRVSGGENTASGGGEQAAPATLTGGEMETEAWQRESESPERRSEAAVYSGRRCVAGESPQKSPSAVRTDPLPEVPSPVRGETDSAAASPPVAAAESEPRRSLSDSFASAASSPVVGRPPAATPAAATAPATPAIPAAPALAAPAAASPAAASSSSRHDSGADSDSDCSLPYFTPRRPRRRPPAAVLESSDEGSDGGGAVPLLTRALRRLPAITSTPAPGVAAGWVLDGTGLPSPVLEAEPTPAPAPPLDCRTKERAPPQTVQGPYSAGGAVASGDARKRQVVHARPDRSLADSPLVVGEYRRGAVPGTPHTLVDETPESSSSSVEMVAAPSRRQRKPPARGPSPSPAREPSLPPVLAARAPLHRAPGRAAVGRTRPAASPMARPPLLPPGVVASVDVARWLEECPLLTAASEESDVVVIDSDAEWDDSDLMSVSERAAAAEVPPDSGLEPPPPPPPQQKRRSLPRPVAPAAAPRTSPPRRGRRQSSSSSSSEDGLEKFKRQFVTPRPTRQRLPSSSSDGGDFIDDHLLSSDSSSYHRAVAADAKTRRTPRTDPQIRASDESLEAAELSPAEPPLFRLPLPKQVKRPAGSARATPSPRPGRNLTFMSSLATHLVEGSRRQTEAAGFVKSFKAKRLQLARRLFEMVNSEVFDSKLPADLEIKFNKRMLRTAGYCYSRQAAGGGPDGSGASVARSARVEISEKVVDSAERLRDTLVHELCHAAAWIVSGYRGGHGPVWRDWAVRVQRRYPELPPVTRCHSYQIHCKYTYRCTGCGYSFGRHSKSLDVTKKVCGRCRGVFECVLTAKPDGKGGAVAASATPRAAAPFALFVKEHYSAVKSRTTGLKHADVMRMLGQKFAEAKISQAKAKATESDDF